jgi:integrase
VAAKVRWYRDAWWVRTHHQGKRYDRRIGPTKADKRAAEEIARKVNATLALGTFDPRPEEDAPVPLGPHLREWHRLYSVTFKPRYRETSLGIVERHLIPFFGDRDLRSIREAELLDYIRVKLDSGQKPATIQNALSILRRVLNLAVQEGLIQQNPANGVGRLIAQVARSEAAEVAQVQSWTRAEAEALLRVAEEHEPRFADLLRFLLSTGARRGEALGLRWEDVDFERSRITIRRALTKGIPVTPKSGRGRTILMPATLAPPPSSILSHSGGSRWSSGGGTRCRRGSSARRQGPLWTSGTSRDPGTGLDGERRRSASAPFGSTTRAIMPTPGLCRDPSNASQHAEGRLRSPWS